MLGLGLITLRLYQQDLGSILVGVWYCVVLCCAVLRYLWVLCRVLGEEGVPLCLNGRALVPLRAVVGQHIVVNDKGLGERNETRDRR